KCQVGAISVGVYECSAVLDLEYPGDCSAETDMNVVMDSNGGFIEIQGTAEGVAFSQDNLNEMLTLAKKGINEIFIMQKGK
nr:ribonuclease PH [Chloroflexota bacterium]